jgi:hypothetical protein
VGIKAAFVRSAGPATRRRERRESFEAAEKNMAEEESRRVKNAAGVEKWESSWLAYGGPSLLSYRAGPRSG